MLHFLETGQPWWLGFVMGFLLSLPVAVLTGIVAARMVQFSDAKKASADAILGLSVFIANDPPRPAEMLHAFQAQMRSVILQFAHLGHTDLANVSAEVRTELVHYCAARMHAPKLAGEAQKEFSVYITAAASRILQAKASPQAFFKWGIFE